MNRDVVTHGKKMGLAAFNFLVSISKEYQSKHYFSFKNTSFILLSQTGERREPIIFRANFSKKYHIFCCGIFFPKGTCFRALKKFGLSASC